MRSELDQYLTFHVSGEQYGLPVLRVREIIEYAAVTPLPRSPKPIRGAVNLRGQVVPVVDLAECFGAAPNPPTKRSCIIMAETDWLGEDGTVGVMADAVDQVLEVVPAAVLPAPRLGARTRNEMVRGMSEQGGKFVLILDLERVLSCIDEPELLRGEAPATGTPEASVVAPEAAAGPAEP